MTLTNLHASEVAQGDRFTFGRNWRHFLSVLSEARIQEAENALCQMLGTPNLQGKRFLDIGSGSGLFSLAARRLGARVVSFDYDPQSVGCTMTLKERYFPRDSEWEVLEGSALDAQFLSSLGTFDIVYSWGVLHHTGQMWQALENALIPLSPGGRLWIAIYNDQGQLSRLWTKAKQIYNRLPPALRLPYTVAVMGPRELRSILIYTLKLRPHRYLYHWTRYDRQRGMSYWHDMVDWIGGYPFEVAKPEAIFNFYAERGLVLEKLKTCGGGLGCNEFVLRKDPL